MDTPSDEATEASSCTRPGPEVDAHTEERIKGTQQAFQVGDRVQFKPSKYEAYRKAAGTVPFWGKKYYITKVHEDGRIDLRSASPRRLNPDWFELAPKKGEKL